jgi:hypothetical protein
VIDVGVGAKIASANGAFPTLGLMEVGPDLQSVGFATCSFPLTNFFSVSFFPVPQVFTHLLAVRFYPKSMSVSRRNAICFARFARGFFLGSFG